MTFGSNTASAIHTYTDNNHLAHQFTPASLPTTFCFLVGRGGTVSLPTTTVGVAASWWDGAAHCPHPSCQHPWCANDRSAALREAKDTS